MEHYKKFSETAGKAFCDIFWGPGKTEDYKKQSLYTEDYQQTIDRGGTRKDLRKILRFMLINDCPARRSFPGGIFFYKKKVASNKL